MKLIAVPRERKDPPDFAATVHRLMTRSGWAPEELAHRAGLDIGEVDAVLRGDEAVPLDAIILLARALEVRPGALIDGNV